jgi:DNA-binding transcriptional LysR family regulator
MKPPQLNLQQIVTFYFVARENSFSTASDSLGITQSAVTHQIKALEAQFGVRLFRLKKQRAYLTPVGEKLLAYADTFVHDALSVEGFLKSCIVSTLRIGVASMIMVTMMPVIEELKERYPDVGICVREGVSAELVAQLLDARFDICFVSQPPAGSAKYPAASRITGYRIIRNRMVFVTSPEYPIPPDVELRWEDIARHPLIIQPEGSTARSLILRQMVDRGIEPTIWTEVDNLEYAKELARQKKGIAFTYWPNVKEDVIAGKLRVIPVSGGDIRLGMDILLDPGFTQSSLARKFIGLLGERFGELSPLPGG